jgi:hypothetical protein
VNEPDKIAYLLVLFKGLEGFLFEGFVFVCLFFGLYSRME